MDVEVIEEIQDGNLFFRKISLDDAEFFFESLNEKAMTKYLSLGPLRDIDHSKRIINNYLRYWDKYLQYNYIIETRGNNEIKKIGSTSLWNLSWLHKRAEIGIWINTKYWNLGIGKKALNLLKNIAFIHLKLHRLEAHIALENSRSIKLFKSSEFKEEGILEEYLNFKGRFHNALVLACLNNNISI